jgi:hypothetical protein
MGILGQAVPAASTATLLYTVPASKRVIFSVLAANGNASDATFELFILQSGESTTDSTTQQDIQVVPADDTYATMRFVASAGQKVYVKCSVSDVAVNVNGFEEDV